MFLGLRTFANRQKVIIISVSVLMVIFTATGLTSLIALYIPWTVRYRYYFKLYSLLIKRVGSNSAVLFTSRGAAYKVEREQATIYRISLIDPKGKAVRAFAIVSNGYLKQVELDGSGDLALEPTIRYLGPMRDIADAKIFKTWHDALKHARVVHVEK